MISQHFKERYQERVHSLNISNDLKRNILQKVMNRVVNSRVSSESVCIHKFDTERDLPRYDDENELWITIRDRVVTTIIRRSEHNRKYTSEIGFDVQQIEYDLVKV